MIESRCRLEMDTQRKLDSKFEFSRFAEIVGGMQSTTNAETKAPMTAINRGREDWLEVRLCQVKPILGSTCCVAKPVWEWSLEIVAVLGLFPNCMTL